MILKYIIILYFTEGSIAADSIIWCGYLWGRRDSNSTHKRWNLLKGWHLFHPQLNIAWFGELLMWLDYDLRCDIKLSHRNHCNFFSSLSMSYSEKSHQTGIPLGKNACHHQPAWTGCLLLAAMWVRPLGRKDLAVLLSLQLTGILACSLNSTSWYSEPNHHVKVIPESMSAETRWRCF